MGSTEGFSTEWTNLAKPRISDWG